MRGAHSTRIITMWDSSKISGKVGCSTSRLMFGTRQRKDREENLGYTHILTAVCVPVPRLESEYSFPDVLANEYVRVLRR